MATFCLPKSLTFLGNFVKVSKSLIFLVKSSHLFGLENCVPQEFDAAALVRLEVLHQRFVHLKKEQNEFVLKDGFK